MRNDKEKVKNSFDSVATSYDDYAIVDQTAAQNLLDMLEVITLAPKRILDLGCGTGYSTKLLAKRYPDAEIIGIDFSDDMLFFAKESCKAYENISFQAMDVNSLTFDLQSFDMVFANMLLPYIAQLNELLFRIRCLLKPEGLLLFSTLGPNTLHEFQSQQIAGVIDMHDIGDLLMQSQLLDPVTEMEALLLQYSSIDNMKKELVGMGIGAVLTSQLDNYFEHYNNSSESPDKFGITFEVVYGHAWGADQLNVTREMPGGEHVLDIGLLKK